VHGDHGYGVKNEVGDMIFDFATSYDIMIANICFKKRDEHFMSCKSG